MCSPSVPLCNNRFFQFTSRGARPPYAAQSGSCLLPSINFSAWSARHFIPQTVFPSSTRVFFSSFVLYQKAPGPFELTAHPPPPSTPFSPGRRKNMGSYRGALPTRRIVHAAIPLSGRHSFPPWVISFRIISYDRDVSPRVLKSNLMHLTLTSLFFYHFL